MSQGVKRPRFAYLCTFPPGAAATAASPHRRSRPTTPRRAPRDIVYQCSRGQIFESRTLGRAQDD